MNILVINNSYPNRQYPNAYVFVHNQVKMLQKRGHHVIVMDIDLRSPRWKRKYGYWVDCYDGVRVYRMSFPFITRSPMPTGVVNKLSEMFAKVLYKKMLQNGEKIDFVHAHFAFGSGAAARKLKKSYNIPYVITEHSSGIHMKKKNTVKASLPCYRSANEIIAVSGVLKKAIKECGIKKEIEVVPNVVDTQKFCFLKDEKEKETFVFLTVARLIDSKRLDLLIDAFAELAKKNQEIRLMIVGNGGSEQKLKEQVEKKQIAGQVEFTGSIPNEKMPDIYRNADCFVLPSNNETFGMVYAEAAACGTPIIATKCGGPEDIVTAENGLLIERNNQKQLEEAMNKIYIAKGQNQYDGEKIHNDIEKRFGENKVYEMLEKIYERL